MEQIRDYAQIEFADDSVMVYQPRYVGEGKSHVRAIVVLPNGQLMEIEKPCADRSSKFVRDIFLQYTDAEIEQFTLRAIAVTAKKQASDARVAERAAREQTQAATFQAKVQALEIAEVRDCPDRRILRRIRRAKSPFEVGALVQFVLQKSFAIIPDQEMASDDSAVDEVSAGLEEGKQ